MRAFEFRQVLLAISFLYLMSAHAIGSEWNQSGKLFAPDVAAGIEFGNAVAMHGDLAVIAAHYDDTAAVHAGAVAVYRRGDDGWGLEDWLFASDPAAGDEFGFSVSVFGDLVVVGAPMKNARGTDSGAVYIFRRGPDAWSEEARLVPSDGQSLDRFGEAIAAGADWVLIGAPYDDDQAFNAGAAYLFRFDGTAWVEDTKLTRSLGGSGELFGSALTLDGDWAVVGAPQAGNGAATIFGFDGVAWNEVSTLTASDGVSGARFGDSVALRGDLVLVGAPRRNSLQGNNSGGAYVYEFDGDGWVETAVLTASDAAPMDNLGWSIATDGATALVGAYRADGDGLDQGAAYVYELNGGDWQQQMKLTAADAAPSDEFGFAVAIDSGYALIGAVGNDQADFDAGAAYAFSRAAAQNSAPSCDSGGDYQATCTDGAAEVLLDGTSSSDADEDDLAFHWSTSCPNAVLDDPNSPTPLLVLDGARPCNTDCTVTLTISDGVNPPVSCDASVSVIDVTPPTLTCSSTVERTVGEPTDPDAIGSPAVEDCDPDVSLTFEDTEAYTECASDPLYKVITRAWTATDSCGNTSSCQQTIVVQKLVLPLDIQPGKCPNRFNPRSKGAVIVALLGMPECDGYDIELSDLGLGRSDCRGGMIVAQVGLPGPRPRLADVGQPTGLDGCACHSDQPDGLVDLVMRFDSAAMRRLVGLDPLDALNGIQLTLSGSIHAPGTPLDGAPFIAVDCLKLASRCEPQGDPRLSKRHRANAQPTNRRADKHLPERFAVRGRPRHR